ncbi:MAG: hypothetical protein EBV40_01140 [Actinobacteria bacterium]|nr:hypothetical protein [Actinomycetota bacterium]
MHRQSAIELTKPGSTSFEYFSSHRRGSSFVDQPPLNENGVKIASRLNTWSVLLVIDGSSTDGMLTSIAGFSRISP